MEILTARRRGEASTSITALALDPRPVVGALGGRMVSRHSILAPDPAHHDAIVLAETLPTTAQARAA
jgi:hypothetical protein